MRHQALLAAEVTRYQALAVQLREDYAGIDEETLADTLEGATDLPDIVAAIVRSSLEDEALAAALKSRMGDMRSRLDRLEERQERKRRLVCEAMGKAGLEKIGAEDFSVSRRAGIPRLEVVNEAIIPSSFMVFQAPKLDRAGLLSALKRGEHVEGVRLTDGEAHIQVRTK